ncbi:MAG: GspE/PulE family protein [Planctomycetota bacterium]
MNPQVAPSEQNDQPPLGNELRIDEGAMNVQFDELWRPDGPTSLPRGPESVLLASGAIRQADLEAADARRREQPHLTIMQALQTLGVIDETAALRATAEYFKLPFREITAEDIDERAYQLLPAEFIKGKNVVPIRNEDGTILVGISDPANIFLIDEIRRRIKQAVKLTVVPPAQIQCVVEDMTPDQDVQIDEIISDIGDEDVEVVETDEAEVTDLEKMAGESPVIRYVNFLITDAVKQGASDIHIEPGDKALKVRYRIDGILFEQNAAPWQLHPAIVSRLKIMANLDISERRLPQDGRIRAMVHGRHVDLRVSILPITHGEKCVIRILDNRSILVGLEQLGMAEDTLASFQHQIHEPHGIVIVTGPTGSGKTTTLYSALRTMDGQRLNISTVEDPVEYELGFCNQVNVVEKIGMTFPAALRSLLRQDPDVVMLGEIRDEETARIAVQAALTGHLVLSTLHTNDAPSSITRLINVGIEPYLIAAAVNAVLAQRLVRRICEHCRRPARKLPDPALLDAYGVDPASVCEGTGCDHCRHTGYAGRVGIYELLTVGDTLRDLVTANPSLTELRRHCHTSGMRSMRQDGMAKVGAGRTTVEEILRVTETEDLPTAEATA